MLMSLISHVLSSYFCFALPSYSTFKAIQHGAVAERDLQRWAMYWAVVGLFISFEYVAEWFISWLPFYWEMKTAFLLFLALPQTEGSTYVYTTHLAPYLTKKEADIDASIVQIQSNILEFIVTQFESLLTKALGVVGIKFPAKEGETSAPGATLNQVAGLWNTFAPSIVGAINQDHPTRPPASTSGSSSSIQTDFSDASSSAFPSPRQSMGTPGNLPPGFVPA